MASTARPSSPAAFRLGRVGFGLVLLLLLALAGAAQASYGDRLDEFKDCVEVCRDENCAPGKISPPIPLHRRLLLWDCPSECDYTCQHIITAARLARREAWPIVQFHGKWPFRRMMGMQEPLSVLFSLGNLWAHLAGLRTLRARVPASYPLRPYYVLFGCIGIASWVFSAVFHARDTVVTERLDYFAAGATVLYGLYYGVVRVARLDKPAASSATINKPAVLQLWTMLCATAYAAHVGYLSLVKWDYGYNMAANVAVGLLQHVLWTAFSYRRWNERRQFWTTWPGFAVAWIMMAMSLELFDFPPWWEALDAHALWHLGTIGPTVLWYNFLLRDAQDDIANSQREKR